MNSAMRYHYLTLEQREALAQRMRASRAGAKLEQALGRLHSPDFGTCIDCGKDIPFVRLQEDPAALHCRDCARLPVKR